MKQKNSIFATIKSSEQIKPSPYTNLIYMSRTSLYFNFQNQTEQAFEFYRSIFGGEFI